MRGAGVITLQVLAFAVGLAVICGLIGFLVVHFADSGDAATGFGWGMLLGGAIVGYAAAAAAPACTRAVDVVSWASGTWARPSRYRKARSSKSSPPRSPSPQASP